MFNWVVKLSFPDGKINYCSSLQFILASPHSVSWGSGEGVWDIPKYAQDDLFTPCTIISPSRRMSYMHVEAGVYVTGCILFFSGKEYLLITGANHSYMLHTYVCLVLSIFFLKKQRRGPLVHHPSVRSGVCISLEPCSLPKKVFQALRQPENLHIDSQHLVAWNDLCQITWGLLLLRLPKLSQMNTQQCIILCVVHGSRTENVGQFLLIKYWIHVITDLHLINIFHGQISAHKYSHARVC